MSNTPKLFTRDGREFTGKITPSARGWWGEEVYPCYRCAGRGGSPFWFPDGGVCYKCHGKNSSTFEHERFRLYTEEVLAKLNARTAEKERRKQEARELSAALYLATTSDEVKVALAYAESIGHILFSMAYARGLTEIEEDNLIRLYKEHLAAVEEAARKERETYFLGEEGSKIEFWGTVVINKPYAMSVGYRRTVENYFHVIKTDDGQSVVYAGSKWFPVGARARFTATVKSQDIYEGGRQTKITRPTMHESGWYQNNTTAYRKYLREDLYAEVWPAEDNSYFSAGSYAESAGSREVGTYTTLEEAKEVAEADAQLLLKELYPPKPAKKERVKRVPKQVEECDLSNIVFA